MVTSLGKIVLFAMGLVIAAQSQAIDQQGRFVIGAVGDSITTGFNSTGWGDRKRDAWATGSSSRHVESHFQKLKKIHGDDKVIAINQAVAGAETKDLMRQAKKLAYHKPDYVTMLIGANDLCASYGDRDETVEAIGKNVHDSIQWLVNANSKVKILLLPLPNVSSLREVGNEKSCKWIWEVTNICRPFLGKDRTEEDLARMDERVHIANELLATMQEKFPENVKMDINLAGVHFEPDWISSLDCFHPSWKGQALLSELAWTTGWFSED